jgi:hypothetical protein
MTRIITERGREEEWGEGIVFRTLVALVRASAHLQWIEVGVGHDSSSIQAAHLHWKLWEFGSDLETASAWPRG